MSDAEVKDLNQISKKDIYHTPSGKYIQFIHDLNITVRQSRQSGVARATCPD